MEKVKIRLHGFLGKRLKREWNLKVKSVGEAISAIDCLTRNKFRKLLIEKDKLNTKYQVIIDGESIEKIDKVENSSLVIKKSMKSIDIIPVIHGAGVFDFLAVIVGITLIAASFGAFGAIASGFIKSSLFIAGVGLFGAGLANLLSKPPDTGEIDSSRESYIFSGPINRVGEGLPVPLVYGQLRVGSHVIATSQNTEYFEADMTETIN